MSKMKNDTTKLSHPIDLRYKCINGFLGKRKIVPTSIAEQRSFKKTIQKIFPDNLFYDSLNEENSVYTPNLERFIYDPEEPINLKYKYKTNLFGKRIQIETTSGEQRKIKNCFIKIFPDSWFYDDLNEENSVKVKKNFYNIFSNSYSPKNNQKTSAVKININNTNRSQGNLLNGLLGFGLAKDILDDIFDDNDDHNSFFDNFGNYGDNDCDCDCDCDSDCDCDFDCDCDCDFDD